MTRLTLKAARDRRDMTQQQLAEASGLRQHHISEIESGDVLQPTPSTMKALSKALGMDAYFGANGLVFEERNS